MRITERKYLDTYFKSIGHEIPELIANYDFSENRGGFDYLTKSSAVYSSNIEGNSIDLNYDKCIGFLKMLPNCLK
ncbi:MAG: hypothetical protein K9J30_02945 [Bacteroidales bacterium]|nr:hypothetical protein [Bacteroidales bacterium]